MAALGRLVAELALDSAQFTEGIQRAQKGLADFRESVSGAAGTALGSFAGQLIALETVSRLADASMRAFTDTIKGLSALDDAAEKTGATVENLSRLEAQAMISGQSFGALEGALIKLNKGLTNADDETKGAGAALEYLGIKARDANGDLKDAAEITEEVANKLADFSDRGPGKAALALALYGKAGAELLPYLKDLADAGELVTRVTAEQASEAEKYEKGLKQLTLANLDLKRQVVSEILPVANQFIEALINQKKAGEGLQKTIKELAEDGSIRRWAEGAIISLGYLIDAARAVPVVFKSVGVFLAAFAVDAVAAGEAVFGVMKAVTSVGNGVAQAEGITQAREALGRLGQGAKYAQGDLDNLAESFTKNSFAEKFRASFVPGAVNLRAFNNELEKTPKKLAAFAPPAKEAKEAADGFAKSLDTLLNKINGKDIGVDSSFAKDIDLLVKAQREGKITTDQYTSAIQKYIQQQPFYVAETKRMEEATKNLSIAAEEEYKLMLKNGDALSTVASGYLELYASQATQLRAAEQDVRLLGLTGAAREKEIINIQLQTVLLTVLDENERKALITQADKLKAAIDAKAQFDITAKALEDQAAIAKRVSDSVSDFFVDLFTNGKKAFDNLGQTVKQFFIKLAAQFASKFVLNIVTSGLSGGGFSGLLGGGSAVSNFIGGASRDDGVGGVIGGSGLIGGIEKIPGIGSFVASLLEPIKDFIPVIGAIIALAGNLFKDKTGIKIDNSVRDGRGRKDIIGSALGSFDVSGDIGNEAFKPLIQTVQSLDKFIADNLLTEGTLNTVKENIQRISSDATDWFGFEDDAGAKVAIEKASKLFLQQRYSVVFDEIDKNVGGLIRNFAGTADELIAYITKLSTGAVVIGKLNAAVPGLNLSLASFANLSDAAQQSVATLALSLDSFNTNTNDAVNKIIANQQLGSVSSYQLAGDAIIALRDKLSDGTIGIEQFAAGVGQLATAYAAATAKIAETRNALAELFASSQENFLLSSLSTEDKYAYFQKQIEDLFAALESATDPETINSLARKIDAAQNSAFGLLDDKGRADLAGEFIDGSRRVEDLVYARLEAAGNALDKQNADLKDVIRDALQDFATQIKATADQDSATAATNAAAANTPVKVEITVNQKGNVEVNA